jgi:hypothetical protein
VVIPASRNFTEVRAHGGAFIIRLSTSHDPYVTAAWQQGRRLSLAPPIRLSRFPAQHAGVSVDLDIEYRKADHADRFRWQIELCFKEWKSYANLHRFDTANPHIAAGLIWAGLCAALLKRFLAHAAQRVGGGAAISTRRVAMCAHLLLTDLVSALLRGARAAEGVATRDGVPAGERGPRQRPSGTTNRATPIRFSPGRWRLSDHL